MTEGDPTLHMLHSLDVERGELGSTVRRGFKWADCIKGERINLCVCTRDPETHDVQGAGLVEEIWVGRFEEIPAIWLTFEHEERSRTYDGLLDSMRHAYGLSFRESEFVTALLYYREA